MDYANGHFIFFNVCSPVAVVAFLDWLCFRYFAFLCIKCTSIKCIKIGWQNLYFVWCLCLPTNIYRQNLNKGNKHTCMSTSCFVLYVCLQQLCRHVVLPGLKSVYIYSCEVVCDEFWFWVHFVGAAGIKQCRYSRLAYRLTI